MERLDSNGEENEIKLEKNSKGEETSKEKYGLRVREIENRESVMVLG